MRKPTKDMGAIFHEMNSNIEKGMDYQDAKWRVIDRHKLDRIEIVELVRLYDNYCNP